MSLWPQQQTSFADVAIPALVGLGCFTGSVTSDPPPPDTGSWSSPAGGHVSASTEERNWAMAAHIGSLVAAWLALGLIAPLLVLLIKGVARPTSAATPSSL